jgi:hypothetical protein
MLDNIWNTIGFGKPTTIRQMFARGVWCLCLSALWLAIGLSGTFLGWLIVVCMSVIAGHWFTRGWTIGVSMLDEQSSETQPPAVEEELILDPDRDYVVNPDAPVWLTVGNYSIQITQKEHGIARINAYHLYREDEDPVATVEV